MREAPRIPWPYRAAALLAALLIGLYMLQFYQFGVQFADLMASISAPNPSGIVPVSIIPEAK